MVEPESKATPVSSSSEAAIPPVADAADRLQRLWQQEQPNVDEFLAQAGPLPAGQLAAVLRVDQRQRWQAGQRVPAENYLQRYPQIQADAEAVLDLIFNEFLLREKRGESPVADEYLGRFPFHAAALRQQIELHQALAERTLSDDARPGTVVGLEQQQGGASAAGVKPTLVEVGAAGLQLPEQFGRYHIVKLLGRGGMGAVYEARDTTLHRTVALKVVLFTGGAERRTVERFYREARAAAVFTHPNLCPVYDVGEIGGIHYLTMPLLSGQPLSARLRESGPWPEEEAAALVARLARALHAAHEAGIIHRDLKPSNIILTQKSEPVVIDFGLAFHQAADFSRLTPADGMLGTPSYLAPEQITGQNTAAGPTTDVYSLGAVFYELLTGRPPFDGTVYQVLRKAVEQDPEPPSRLRPKLSPGLEAVCLNALHKDPRARFASMTALAEALEALPQRSTPVVRAWAPSMRWLTSRRQRLALAAAGVVLLVVLAALLFFRPWEPVADQAAPLDALSTAKPKPLSRAITIAKRTPPAALPAAKRKPRPSALPAVELKPPLDLTALFKAGSRWKGGFRFRKPHENYASDVEVVVTSRTGNHFQGEYATEGKKWQWKIKGVIEQEQVRWEFTEIIYEYEPRTVVGKAKFKGTCRGDELTGQFYIPEDTEWVADMKLHLTRKKPRAAE
jgi:serine/threonine-protein kinase